MNEIEEMKQAIEILLKDEKIYLLRLTSMELFALLANIQLACRHPDNNGPSRDYVQELARFIQDKAFPPDTFMGRVVERGWHSFFDVKREEARRHFPHAGF